VGLGFREIDSGGEGVRSSGDSRGGGECVHVLFFPCGIVGSVWNDSCEWNDGWELFEGRRVSGGDFESERRLAFEDAGDGGKGSRHASK
jgi:hypothetical protein